MSTSTRAVARAIVLASGGLDSTTLLAIARDDGFEPVALTFLYGQTHAIEVERARVIAARAGVREHHVLRLPLGEIGGSALLGDGEIPPEPPGGAGSGGIPATYVPARNLIFLAVAASVAEAGGMRDIYIGANHLDSSGYPDCRPAFFEACERTLNLGTRDGVERAAAGGEPWFRIRTPLLNLRKSEIIERGVALGVDYSLTVSCYAPDADGRACGRCDSCGLRRRAFEEARVHDPTPYRV